MSKGDDTRARIVALAEARASVEGLMSLSIGELAAEAGMSKSGLFARFGSKDELRRAVLESMTGRFRDAVWVPSAGEAHGLGRLRAIFKHWKGWIDGYHLPGGCPIMTAVNELDDHPGPLRDYLRDRQDSWSGLLAREWERAQDRGEIGRGVDGQQFAFEVNGIMMAYGWSHRLMNDPRAARSAEAAFEGLIARAGPP